MTNTRGHSLLLTLPEGDFHRACQGEVCLQLLRFSNLSLACNEGQSMYGK